MKSYVLGLIERDLRGGNTAELDVEAIRQATQQIKDYAVQLEALVDV